MRTNHLNSSHAAWGWADPLNGPRSIALFALVVACSSPATSPIPNPQDDAGGPPPTSDSGTPALDAASPKADAAAEAAPPPPGNLTAGTTTLSITAAGQSRSVLVYAPAAVKSGPLPLVIALHGNGDTSSNFVASIGLQALADQNNFILAAPQGITQSFTYYGQTLSGIDWDAYRTVNDGNIDLPLLDAIRAQLQATGSVDTHHVMTFGYSQGGYLSFRYAMDASASLSCGAVIAAADPLPGQGLVASAARKIPIAMQIGTLDWNIQGARSTETELQQNGNPLQYVEIQGAGHVPFPGSPGAPLGWCLAKSL